VGGVIRLVRADPGLLDAAFRLARVDAEAGSP
jgi:hypothetical protein